jgi:hypothetical protein
MVCIAGFFGGFFSFGMVEEGKNSIRLLMHHYLKTEQAIANQNKQSVYAGITKNKASHPP